MESLEYDILLLAFDLREKGRESGKSIPLIMSHASTKLLP